MDQRLINFEVVPSLDKFLFSDAFLPFVIGPIGSTKTTAGIMKVLYHASKMAPCIDGIRRSRAIWVRNTREQLRDTSIPDFLKWFPDGVYGSYLKSEYKYSLRVGDIECEVLFRGLDDSNDVRRLLSLQASFGVLDEFREINSDVFEALQGRLGRYPDKSMVPHRPEWGLDDNGIPVGGCVTDDGEPNIHLWGMSNPPDFDTYWEEFASNPPANADITIQPSGLSPEADWLHFLPSDYYNNLAEGKTEDWIDVYIHAKFGKSLAGHPVHRSFNRDIHVSKSPLKPNAISSEPIIIGLDAALHPAAVIGQLAHEGRLMIFDALHATGMGMVRFLDVMLKPLLSQKYPGMRVLVVVDPSGTRRMDTDEATVVQMIKNAGLSVKPAATNRLPPRIAAVDTYLTRMVDGKAAILIDPSCTDLIKALAGRYRYKIKKDGEQEDQPDKTHPWSDIADALQYLCLHASNGSVIGANVMPTRREVKPAPYRWAA